MVLVLPGMFSPSVKRIGDFVPMIYGLILAFTFISLIGVWHMKKWGAEMYILFFFLKLSFLVVTGQFGPSSVLGIVFSLFFITVFFIYYKRMDRNL
jgi:hypothetical protein